MRIQNNITAMNTHRQYTINNENVAKNAEKLSSGYKINRAGDDAAGLAISEKMRSQIRGLNMATKNSQDAISLVQTAEGALQETQNMLQRMNELAVQAATGTNEDLDRTALAKEFEQLKREINDVAQQTNFNNMNILDGSLSYTGYVRSAQTAGVTVNASAIDTADRGLEISNNVVKGAQAESTGAKGVWAINVDDSTQVTVDGSGIGTMEIKVNIDAKEQTLKLKTSTDTGLDAGNYTYKDLGATNQALFIDNSTSWNAGTDLDFSSTAATAGKISIEQQNVTDLDKGESIPKITDNGGNKVAVTTTAVGKTAGAQGESIATINFDNLSAGDTITIGGETLTLAEADLTDFATLQNKVNGFFGAGGSNVPTGLTVTMNNNTLLVKQTAIPTSDATNYDTSIKYGSATADASRYKNTIEFDPAKMKDGDTFTLEVGGEKVTFTFDERKYVSDPNGKSAAEKLAADVASLFEKADVKASGNAIIFEGNKVSSSDLKLEAADGSQGDATKLDENRYGHNALRIQVGALENEQLAVSIDAMNTAGLKLDDANLDTQNAAGSAITATRNAINMVSEQRATLGAMQNRLDHKIANLKVTTENLSAAESRIRDVDMASEMTEFTKNNILRQASTAMLAQANALPQNVLSLLG